MSNDYHEWKYFIDGSSYSPMMYFCIGSDRGSLLNRKQVITPLNDEK